jgi:hypothetical protein
MAEWEGAEDLEVDLARAVDVVVGLVADVVVEGGALTWEGQICWLVVLRKFCNR